MNLSLQLRYLIYLAYSQRIEHLTFHFLVNLSFIYITCIYKVLGTSDFFYFLCILFQSIYVLFSIFFSIKEDNTCKELKSIQVNSQNNYLYSIFENKLINSITHFFLKYFNELTILLYYVGVLFFCITGQLRHIVMIALFIIALNKGISRLSGSSVLINNLIKTTKYCCISSIISRDITKLAGVATGSIIFMDLWRVEQLLRAPSQAARDDLIGFWRERLSITPSDQFQGHVKASGKYIYNSVTGTKNINDMNTSDDWIIDDEIGSKKTKNVKVNFEVSGSGSKN